METLKKILFLLTPYEKRNAAFLLLMILLMAVIDMVGVASILPFMAVLVNPSIIEKNIILINLFEALKIFGVEISEEINQLARERLENLGIDAELKVGQNNCIPYRDQFFDFIVACHSCYYVNEGSTFNENLVELSRVLRTEGVFIASLPMRDNFIFNDAELLSDGHYRITKDPYGIRKGTIHKTFINEDEIIEIFSPYYKDLSIGYINDNYYGINVKMWIIKATRK